MSRTLLAVAALLGVAFVQPRAACAQEEDHYRRQVTGYLEQTRGELIGGEGYRQYLQPLIGTLDEGDWKDYWIEVEAGESYAVIGVCDEDCTDVDLEIFNVEGESLDADYLEDDYPLVRARPEGQGSREFRVRVAMAACSTEPCWYAVGVYAKR